VESSVPVASKAIDDVQETGDKVPAKLLKKLLYKKRDEDGNVVQRERTITNKETQEKTKKIEDVELLLELPYLPHCVDYSGCCQAISINGNLLSPCLTRPMKGSSFCRTCTNAGIKYGTLQDREKVEVGHYEVTLPPTQVKVTNKETGEVTMEDREITKKEISYGTWLQKRGIDRSFVEKMLEDHNLDITIPESYFKVNKSKAKRTVKKTTSTSSDDEASSIESEPVQAAEVVVAPAPVVQDDDTKSVDSTSSAESSDDEEKPKKSKKSKKEKKEKKEKKDKKEKKKRGRPAKAKAEVVTEEIVEKVAQPEPAAEEEKEVVEPTNTELEILESDDGLTYFKFKGEKFLYDEEMTIWSLDDGDIGDQVGTWDPESNTPTFSADLDATD
tara:strand:- start:311 stop:1471 length:1161 start_codon:yes stop_codon:yes gene_type:complete